jgi:hypothetical protein
MSEAGRKVRRSDWKIRARGTKFVAGLEAVFLETAFAPPVHFAIGT